MLRGLTLSLEASKNSTDKSGLGLMPQWLTYKG